MRPHHRTLGRHQVHRSALKPLQEHVPLGDYSRRGNASSLCSVLRVVAGAVTSPHAACDRLDRIACEDTIRKALYATLPESAALQRLLNGALAGRLPRAAPAPQRLAIDLTLIAYHGEPFRDPKEVDRSPAEQGTRHFHSLRHRLRRAPRAAVHRGADGSLRGGGAEGRTPAPAEAGPCGRGPAPAAAAGPRLLRRGGDPLPPGGPVPVPDAGAGPRPQGRRPRGAERDAALRPDGARRVARVHRHGRRQADGAGVDLRGLPRLPGPVEAARSAGAGLCLLGRVGAVLRGCGRRTGRGSGSSRAIGGWTGQGVGRRAGGRRCGCCRWGSRRCCATSGCGCITRCCRRRVAGDGDCGRSGCGCERCCTGWCRWSKRHSGPWGRREWKGDHVEDL